jgi:hypothetical protein
MKRVFDGLSLIVLGVVLLACSTGYLSWAVWISVFSLWPLLLVGAGIDLIGKSTEQEWLRALSSVVFIGAVLYGAFVMPAGTWGLPWSTGGAGESFSQREVGTADMKEGTAKIEAGATRLTLKGGSDLLSIAGMAPAGARPTLAVNTDGSTVDVSVDQPRETVVWVGTAPRRRLDVTLDRALRWNTLYINAGATQGDVDLSDVDVRTLTVNAGASDTKITFGDKGSGVSADISAGAANVTLRVPRSASVRVSLSGALTSASMPDDFVRESGNGFIGDTVWTSEGPGSPIVITVRAGVASIAVQRY